jgi:muconolactone delta-isomerase
MPNRGILAGHFTEAETAKQLKRTTRTLQIWRRRGEGPAYTKLGRSVFYSAGALQAWLKANERQPVREVA